MNDQPESNTPRTHAEIVAEARRRREAAALRANLGRRKAQSRERSEPDDLTPPHDPTQKETTCR